MYSVLLMVAMTGTAEAPAFHPYPVATGCYGSHGCYGSTSYPGTTYSGCQGSSGCYGTTYSGTTYSGCYGTTYHGCYGTTYHGCYGIVPTPTYHSCMGCLGGGCTGMVISSGCCGGHVVTPSVTVEDKKEQPKKEDKKEQPKKEDQPKIEGKEKEVRQGDAPATLVVNLPADATLTVDGVKTAGTTARRAFVSPTLKQGKDFYYTLNVEVLRHGKPVTISREAVVRAGEETTITIQDPSVIARR